MTVKSVEDQDSEHWELIDLDTDTMIDSVLWADDESGYYIRQEKREEGWVKVLHRGNIRLEDQRERYDPPLEARELKEAEIALELALERAKAIVSYLEEQVAISKANAVLRGEHITIGDANGVHVVISKDGGMQVFNGDRLLY